MAGEAVTIRRATERDLAALLNLYGAFNDDALPLDDGEADAIFAQIDDDLNQTVLVAEEHRLLLGTLTLVVVPGLAYGGRPWAAVAHVIVAAAARGRGIAAALLDEAIARATGAGCYTLLLAADLARADAARLLARPGIVQTHAGFSLSLMRSE